MTLLEEAVSMMEDLEAENAKLKAQIEAVKEWRLWAHEATGIHLKTDTRLCEILEIPAKKSSAARVAYAMRMRKLFDKEKEQ